MLYVHPKYLFIISDFSLKRVAAMVAWLVAATNAVKMISLACVAASTIINSGMEIHDRLKTAKNNTPGTSKLSLEMISQVFTQVHIFNYLSLYI